MGRLMIYFGQIALINIGFCFLVPCVNELILHRKEKNERHVSKESG